MRLSRGSVRIECSTSCRMMSSIATPKRTAAYLAAGLMRLKREYGCGRIAGAFIVLDVFTRRMPNWWIGGLVDWWIGGLVDWWIGGLVGWWVGGLVDWWGGGEVGR